MASETPNPIRDMVLAEIARRQIVATPQAIAAITESIGRSAYENLGCTDTVLAGLLFSGSYTADVLELAGADPRFLRDQASMSAAFSPNSNDQFDPIREFFFGGVTGDLFANWEGDEGPLETSHLLRAAISPDHGGDPLSSYVFPYHLRADTPDSSPLLRKLETRVAELLSYMSFVLRTDETMTTVGEPLTSNRGPLTDHEEYVLDNYFGKHYEMTGCELDFAISAFNNWIQYRRLVMDPPELCVRTLGTCNALLIAPGQFANAGGDLKVVENCLATAKLFSPERDLNGMALFLRDGQIRAGEYTYRNTFAFDSKTLTGNPFRPVSVRAIRPVCLIARQTLQAFEMLISKPSIRELELQEFLEAHPEILSTLGYTNILPHICLRSETSSELIPDFLLEIPGERGFDILDLKLPTANLIARRPYTRISSELTKAIAQLRQYERFFHKAKHRKEFHRKFGLTPFRPELMVVIGRSSQFAGRRERIEIEEQLGKVKLFTYDDLIAYGRSRVLEIEHTT